MKLIRDDRHDPGGEITVYGHATSESDGSWSYAPPAAPLPNGYYQAVAARRQIHAGTCRRARSERVFVD